MKTASISSLRIALARAQAEFARAAQANREVCDDYYGAKPSGAYNFGDVLYYGNWEREARIKWNEAETQLNTALAQRDASRPLRVPLARAARITHWQRA